MITDGDLGNILYKMMQSLGLPVYQGGNQKSFSGEDRVVINMHKMEKEKQYMKCFANAATSSG